MSNVKPITFSGDMVRALLDGRKTQASRLIRVQPPTEEQFPHSVFGIIPSVAEGVKYFSCNQYRGAPKHPTKWELDGSVGVARDAGFPMEYMCPIAIGDLLWVREAWRGIVSITPQHQAPEYGVARYIPNQNHCARVEYKATHDPDNEPYRPSIHMPRWASRLSLKIKNVRAQQLLDISESEAVAEGFTEGQINDGFSPRDIGNGCKIESFGSWASAKGMFQIYWQKTHPEWDGYSSPWVWIYEFEVLKENIDIYLKGGAP